MVTQKDAQKWFNNKYTRRKKASTKDINISSKSFDTHLRMEGFLKAKEINIEKFKLGNLEISGFPELTEIKFINNCQIKRLTVSDCPKLTKLDYSGIELDELDGLEIVDCSDFSSNSLNNSNQIKNLKISLCPNHPDNQQSNSSLKVGNIENIRNILIVGRTGNGKSTLSNVLCDTNEFEESGYSVSMTKNFRRKSFTDEKNSNSYRVVDTIGIGDTKLTKKEVLYRIAEGIYSMPEGISQVLFVVSGRFTREEIKTYEIFEKAILRSDIPKYVTIVRTRFNNFADKEECEKDKKKLLEENKELAKILESCVGIIHVDNPPKNTITKKNKNNNNNNDNDKTNNDDKTNNNDDDKKNDYDEILNKINQDKRNESRNILLEHLKEVCKENYKFKKWDKLRKDITPYMKEIRSEDEKSLEKVIAKRTEHFLPKPFRKCVDTTQDLVD